MEAAAFLGAASNLHHLIKNVGRVLNPADVVFSEKPCQQRLLLQYVEKKTSKNGKPPGG